MYGYEEHRDYYYENPYHVMNREEGHRYNCGYAAGADCSCGKIPYCYYEGCEAMGGDENGCPECRPERYAEVTFPKWKVTVQLGAQKKHYAVCVCEDYDEAKEQLKRYTEAKWKRPTLSRVNNAEELANAEFQMEKIKDWSTD